MGMKVANRVDVWYDEGIIDMSNEGTVVDHVGAGEGMGLNDDGREIGCSKGSTELLLLLSGDMTDVVKVEAQHHHIEGAQNNRPVLGLRLKPDHMMDIGKILD